MSEEPIEVQLLRGEREDAKLALLNIVGALKLSVVYRPWSDGPPLIESGVDNSPVAVTRRTADYLLNMKEKP